MFVQALPGDMGSAADGLAGIGTSVVGMNAGVSPMLNGVMPPAPEPASVLMAAMFQAHGVLYQLTQAWGSVMHQMFVTTLATSAGSYAADEVANALTML